jgi:hypothetical protein
MTPTEKEVAQQLRWVLEPHPIDVQLTAIAEALARVIAAQDCEPDAAFAIVVRFTREWLARGGLRPSPLIEEQLIRVIDTLRGDPPTEGAHGTP